MNKPVVLITGALTGIGRAAALAFAQQGAHIVIAGRRPDAGIELTQDLERMGAQAIFVRADVTKETEVERLIATTLTHFGRLDVAVNNAGIEGMLGPITDQTEQNYMDTFKTNVWGGNPPAKPAQ